MAEILLFSDLHLAAHKGKPQRLQDCLDVLYWVLITARNRGIKHVVFAGDFFQDRHRISVYAYHQTYKIISQFEDLSIWLLLGNHDLWYYEKADISSIIPIGALPYVTVIDQPTTHNIAGLDIDFLPFTHNPVAILAENFQHKSPVLVGHVAIDGSTLNSHHRTKAEVSVEFDNEMVKVSKDIFDGYKKVFLGHYHCEQKLNDIVEYIGSTLQLTFNEAFQKKHIIVLNTETLGTEYIENTFSPKHYILKCDELEGYQFNNDFVRIIYDVNQSDMLEMRSKVLEQYPDINITFTQEEQLDPKMDKECAKKFNLMEGDTLDRYVHAVGHGDLDYHTLLRIGKDICFDN